MTTETILIVALSGRMLAASAQRAGYCPLVVDCFADDDTLALSGAVEKLPSAFTCGFDERSLSDALHAIMSKAGVGPTSNPLIVLGAGFECEPEVIAALSREFRLCACDASVVSRSKDPAVLFPLLRDLGIVHPETRLDPPAAATEPWLSKRIGGSGGTHIFRYDARRKVRPNRYYQREVSGELISATSLIGSDGQAFAFTRSWLSPSDRHPFRFGGITGHVELDEDIEARIVDACVSLAPALALKGLVSFDFIVVGDEPHLIEVNPRPGASLDILDDASGTLFKAHLAAFTENEAVELLSREWRPHPQAAAYVYADRGELTVPDVAWPEWVSDRPPPGRVIPPHAPVVTVRTLAEDPDTAEQVCRVRTREIADVLYQSSENQGKRPDECK
ncbi:Aldehyde oxidase [Candidatus Filomicrobium marinum]|uniref:Aldehyde oxidase n=1 Tax=Candidatus Filomicrobium marinum TaxID=1608628 RepID=A0A0D6JC22_9HYPH|nr:ATP-grasp domain-containing protein [Candidatus Filomicrobium marinum]CFX04102.1 Aldehyde oxidase [Candidatus Filomicrobium marinum]CPR15973.1 Aldehyde oxidase [Candidatus Filomicrobium marinum]